VRGIIPLHLVGYPRLLAKRIRSLCMSISCWHDYSTCVEAHTLESHYAVDFPLHRSFSRISWACFVKFTAKWKNKIETKLMCPSKATVTCSSSSLSLYTYVGLAIRLQSVNYGCSEVSPGTKCDLNPSCLRGGTGGEEILSPH
jgi:hypothetical protein